MDEGGTYLEDFLLSLEMLPNDVRRDFELMKDLDKECMELNRELTELENAYLESQLIISKRKFDAPDEDEISQREAEKKSRAQSADRIISLRKLTRQKLMEKTAIAVNMGNIIDRFSRKLDTDLAFFETDLKGCGEFETPKGAEPGSEVAFSLTPDVPVLPPLLTKSSSLMGFGSNTNLAGVETLATSSVSEQFMMLGRVICYHADSGMYDILDVDDSKKYLLPERQVIVLDLIESQRKLCKAEVVFALYPDTTSFYPATVSHAPRRSAMGAEPSVIVQFNGDEDATGVVPDRVVPLKYVVRMADPPPKPVLSRMSTSNSSSSLANMYGGSDFL